MLLLSGQWGHSTLSTSLWATKHQNSYAPLPVETYKKESGEGERFYYTHSTKKGKGKTPHVYFHYRKP